MKKETPIIIIVIAISVLFLIFISLTKRHNNVLIFNIEKQLIEANSNYDLLKRQESLAYKTIGTYREPIRNKESIIFLRLHEHICFNCYAPALSNLQSYLRPFTNTYKIIILGSFKYNSRLDWISKEFNLEDYYHINVPSDSLGADELNSPYFFTVSKDSKINHILFFDKYTDNSHKISLFLSMLNSLSE